MYALILIPGSPFRHACEHFFCRLLCVLCSHLHPFNPPDSSASIVGSVYCRPLLLWCSVILLVLQEQDYWSTIQDLLLVQNNSKTIESVFCQRGVLLCSLHVFWAIHPNGPSMLPEMRCDSFSLTFSFVSPLFWGRATRPTALPPWCSKRNSTWLAQVMTSFFPEFNRLHSSIWVSYEISTSSHFNPFLPQWALPAHRPSHL